MQTLPNGWQAGPKGKWFRRETPTAQSHTTGQETRRKVPPYRHKQWMFGTGQPVTVLRASGAGSQPQAVTEQDGLRSKGSV